MTTRERVEAYFSTLKDAMGTYNSDTGAGAPIYSMQAALCALKRFVLAQHPEPQGEQPLADELEQCRVQLAGCSAAALGAIAEPAQRGDYGWSPAYQDVLDLRLEVERLRSEQPPARRLKHGYFRWYDGIYLVEGATEVVGSGLPKAVQAHFIGWYGSPEVEHCYEGVRETHRPEREQSHGELVVKIANLLDSIYGKEHGQEHGLYLDWPDWYMHKNAAEAVLEFVQKEASDENNA